MAVTLRATSSTSGDAAWVPLSGVGVLSYQSAIPISAGNTVNDRFFPPSSMTVTGIWVYAATAPASAAGTYTLAVTNEDNASASLLVAATFNLETLVSDTYTQLDLTATTANLLLDAHDQILASFVSDNGDLTGAGLYWGIYGTAV